MQLQTLLKYLSMHFRPQPKPTLLYLKIASKSDHFTLSHTRFTVGIIYKVPGATHSYPGAYTEEIWHNAKEIWHRSDTKTGIHVGTVPKNHQKATI